MESPKFRCATGEALDSLAMKLGLRESIPQWDSLAGYSYTPSNPDDIQAYIDYYLETNNEDEKFALIEMIIESVVEQSNEQASIHYWSKVKPIVVRDYEVHKYTLHYWLQLSDFSDYSEKVVSEIREIIRTCTGC